LAEGGGRWERDEGEDAPAEPAPASALPAGTAAGTALHALLETVDFASAANTADPAAFLALPGMAEFVEREIRRHGLPADCAPEIASLIWHSLRMPIPDPGAPAEDSFRLADIAERRAEVEFLLRVEGQPSRLPEGVAARDGFLWGFIDLVFRREGRYYLLDWKSNRLDAYDPASVQASMEEHRYDLQWKLYAVALDRWLKARLPGYDPTRHFGGVIYLYLRGAAGAADGFSGFRHRPRPKELREEYPGMLREALRLL
jgi:exodeoxyribonuclease V beta subunit